MLGGLSGPGGRSPQAIRQGPAGHTEDLGGDVLPRPQPQPLPEPGPGASSAGPGGEAARPPAALLGSGPGALHAHVGTCGPPRAGHVLISPLSWEFCLKANKPKKSWFCPRFLPLPGASGLDEGHPRLLCGCAGPGLDSEVGVGLVPRVQCTPSDWEGMQREGRKDLSGAMQKPPHFLSGGVPCSKAETAQSKPDRNLCPLPFPGGVGAGVPGEAGLRGRVAGMALAPHRGPTLS